MIDIIQLRVTTVGSAGSATGSATTRMPVNGKIYAVHTDFTTQPATTDTTLTSTLPTQTILTLTNTGTDALDYPRVLLQGATGADLTTVYDKFIVAGYLTVTVAQGDAITDGVIVTIYLERD
jgi:hypothetical protein